MLTKNSEKALKRLKILYVEDEKDILKLTSMVLEDYVGKLYTASNGKEALEILKKKNIDVVLTDILMPKLNGIELIREIRKNHRGEISIIVTTAHTETQYLLDCIELQVDGYLLKPIDVDELLRVILKATLPKLQTNELYAKNALLSALTVFVSGKKIEIIKYLIERSDTENIYYGSYEDIVQDLNVSKPTVVKTFKQLIDTGLLVRLKNKIYKFHPDIAKYRGYKTRSSNW